MSIYDMVNIDRIEKQKGFQSVTRGTCDLLYIELHVRKEKKSMRKM